MLRSSPEVGRVGIRPRSQAPGRPGARASLAPSRSLSKKQGTPADDRVESDSQALTRKWHGPDRLSKKFDSLKTSDPFGKSKHVSNFALAYSQGSIPCRINHGVVVSRLQWDEDPAALEYDPLLLTVSDGLRETKHPFVFVAQTAFKELMEAPGAAQKTAPLLANLVRNLRAAMMTPGEGPFAAALSATRQLSNCVGPELNDHLGVLLIQINKKSFERKYKTQIFETLLALDENGGPNAGKIIKSKVPCFSK